MMAVKSYFNACTHTQSVVDLMLHRVPDVCHMHAASQADPVVQQVVIGESRPALMPAVLRVSKRPSSQVPSWRMAVTGCYAAQSVMYPDK
jgi:hypothetical protein